MRLLVNHPLVATRDCDHCRAWLYDEDKGTPVKQQKLDPETGEEVESLVPRYKSVPPPCEAPRQSCPKGSPTAGIELTPQNWKAYNHFRTCRTLGRFPEDSVVERNAAIIGDILDTFNETQDRLRLEFLRMIATTPRV